MGTVIVRKAQPHFRRQKRAESALSGNYVRKILALISKEKPLTICHSVIG